MTEHLFKLKKDGKTVGYLKFKNGKFIYSNEDGSYVSPYCISIWEGKVFSFSSPAYDSSYYEHDECEYDSIHPFVTKDKNGKDVFADDKITFIPAAVFGTKKRQTTTVYFCDRRLAYCVKSKAWDMRIKFNCEDIELIEEQK